MTKRFECIWFIWWVRTDLTASSYSATIFFWRNLFITFSLLDPNLKYVFIKQQTYISGYFMVFNHFFLMNIFVLSKIFENCWSANPQAMSPFYSFLSDSSWQQKPSGFNFHNCSFLELLERGQLHVVIEMPAKAMHARPITATSHGATCIVGHQS